MCYIIDSESVLLNYFSKNESSEISFRDLRSLRKKIEENSKDPVYVDIRYNSLRDAISLHRDVFSMELTRISIKKTDAEELKVDFVDKIINSKLPDKIKAMYMDLISSTH
jgi:hypothetical protein